MVMTTQELMTCAFVEVENVQEVEKLAIAMALTLQGKTIVVTDSQQAYGSFQYGWLSHLALQGLKDKKTF